MFTQEPKLWSHPPGLQIEMMEEDSESTIIDTNKDCQESQETLEKGGVKQPLLKWSSYLQSPVAPHKGFKLLEVGCLFHWKRVSVVARLEAYENFVCQGLVSA